MKKLLLACALILAAAGLRAQTSIVVYFSATGTTRIAAEQLAAEQNAVLWEIEPAEPYTDADLDWRNKQSRSSLEMQDPEERPMIRQCTNIMPYTDIYLGFPIWWGICPRIINSWLDNNLEQLEGKTIHLFATSGGSSIDKAADYISSTYPSLRIADRTLLKVKR